MKSFRLVVAFALICFALSPAAQAVVPAPDGGYPGGNTAEGQNTLFSLTTGGFNTAVGYFSLRSDITGTFNTAVGAGTLLANTADQNTATGAGALLSNTTGANNTANGALALFNSSTGVGNTANGAGALLNNSTGSFNTADGVTALANNTTGENNTGVGTSALLHNTSGGNNIALGLNAGSSLTTGNNNINIGHSGIEGESSTIRIGSGSQIRTFIAAIYGITTGIGNAIPVLIDSEGQLGTMSSSRRYKTDIKPIDKASESILALKPVSFRYKIHKDNTRQFGLIAEEVAEVNQDLVVRDKDGQIYTMRYDAINAMLLNEFVKEHRKNEKQETTIEQLKSTVAKQQATIAQQQKGMEAVMARLNEQAAQIQKVSAELEVNKAASRTVLNNQ
jgi:uncharacterized coiled-coil protein SlyX